MYRIVLDFIDFFVLIKGISEAIFIENDGVPTILAGYENFYQDPEYCKQMTNVINHFFYESKIKHISSFHVNYSYSLLYFYRRCE